MGHSPEIEIIQTLLLDYVGSWLLAVEFGIVSIIYGMLKSSSSNKLKPIFFPEGGNSILYVIIMVYLNGVEFGSSSQWIKFSRFEFWINISVYSWSIKELSVWFYYANRL